MDIEALVKLTSRAWALDILALMHGGVAGRQAVLLAATGASRAALRQSLEHVVALGLLERNPGHGHPLRPEYRLTRRGAAAAKLAAAILRAVPDRNQAALLRKAWTVPVLAVTAAPCRFSEIKARLHLVTDRALSLSLERLQARHWLQRDIDLSDRPPRPLYRAANTGRDICRAISATA